jgi:hypothetical protein
MPSTPFNPSTPNGEDVNSFHLKDDVDKSALSHHHTLGVGDTQASPGSHRHNGTDSYQIDYNDLLNLPSGTVADYTSTIKHEVKLGEAIAKGQAVYVSSADGTNMIVSKASNASEATSSKTLGLLETGGSTNAKVNVITEGLLAGLDTSTATTGDPVWLGTSGNLIYGWASKPVAPAHLVFIGIVTRVNSNNGEIFVRPQNGFEFNELHDVLIVAPASGEVIQRTASNLWENKTLAEANIATADHLHTGVYSPVGHTHDDRYYTETETDTLLSGKSNTGHTHDDRYYTETEITSLLSGKSDTGHLHTGVYSPVGHTHAISDVTSLSTTLDGKAPLEGWTANRVLVANGSGAITASTTIDTTELGYLNGVTSNLQTQIGAKANNSGYTASRVLISDASGNVVVSPLVSTTELDYLDGVTSAIQSQLNGKAATGHTHITSEVTGLDSALAGKASTTHTHAISDVTGLQTALDAKALAEGYTANRVLVSNGAGAIGVSTTIDTTELGYLNGVTSNLQTQLDGKDVKELYRFETADNLIMSSVGSATTASVFGTNGVAVEASTAYLVEGVIYFTAGVVGTSATHIINWGSPSGAATVTRNNWLWDYNSSTTALNLAAAMSGVRRGGTTSFAALNTITMTGTHLFRGQFYGIVEFNAAGNFTPRITVTPTSASVDLTINSGSYIKLQKLGTTNTNGTWS